MSVNYLVIKETTAFRFCETCAGTGKKTRSFQGRRFTVNCVMCKGTGKQELKQTTHISLQQALIEINKDNNGNNSQE